MIVKDIEKQYEKDQKILPPRRLSSPFGLSGSWFTSFWGGRRTDTPCTRRTSSGRASRSSPSPGQEQLFKMLVTNFSNCKVISSKHSHDNWIETDHTSELRQCWPGPSMMWSWWWTLIPSGDVMSVSLRKEDTRTQDDYIISFTELLSSFAIIPIFSSLHPSWSSPRPSSPDNHGGWSWSLNSFLHFRHSKKNLCRYIINQIQAN